MGISLRDRFPLHLTIGERDCTFLLAESFTFSNVDPGGFEAASFPIPHDLPWVQRGMPIRVDSGTQVAWEGRVKEIQRSLGAKTLIQCEGYAAILKDQTMSMIYVDRDLSKWGPPSNASTIKLLEENFAQGSTSLGPDTNTELPAVVQTITGAWASPAKPIVAAWYDAGPDNLIKYIYFHLLLKNAVGAVWTEKVRTSQNDIFTGATESSANLNKAGAGEAKLLETGNPLRFAELVHYTEETPAGTNGLDYVAIWRELAVYGNHGLTLRGSPPYGIYPSDIVTHAVAQASGVQAGVITEAASVLPHAVYKTPVWVEQPVSDMAKMVGYHWGVWESLTYLAGNTEPRLDFRPYPVLGEPTAWVRRSECDALDVREDLAGQYNRAQVTFTEAAGNEGVAEVEVANPILQAAGIGTRTIQLSLGTSVPAAAVEYGQVALETLQLQARVLGSATIKEPVHTMGGGEIAPWMLKAGIDRLRIPDLPSFDVWGAYNELPVKRVECSGSSDGLTTSVEFGAGPSILEAITAQLQTATEVAQGR